MLAVAEPRSSTWTRVFDLIRVPRALTLDYNLPRRSWRGYTAWDDMVFVDRRRWKRQLRRAREWQGGKRALLADVIKRMATLVEAIDLSAGDIQAAELSTSERIAARSAENKE